MAPIKKTVMTPKGVYFPQHEAKDAPTSHPTPPGTNAALGSQQQQTQERE